ncbi:rSAM-modified peptide [Flavobacterium mesophilum]
MANKTLKFEDFEAEKLSKNEQKIVRGGDGEDYPPYDPGKGSTGKGGNG